MNRQEPSQRHRSNWVDDNEDDEEDGDADGENGLYVQSTPPYH